MFGHLARGGVHSAVMMSPEGDGGAGAGGEGGGATGGDPNAKTVPLDQYKKALDEMHSAKETLKNTSTQLETLKSEIETIKTSKAKESGDFKSLYEKTLQDKADLEKRHNDFRSAVIQDKRLGILESELRKRGLKQGSESIMDLADLEKMPFETTNKGRFLIHGADQVAADLETKYSAAFDKGKSPVINTGGGNGGGGAGAELTADYMVELEAKDPKKYRELMPKYLEQYQKRKAT